MATAQIQVPTMNNGAMGVVEQLDSPFVRRQSTRHPWPAEVADDVNGYVQRVIDFYRLNGFPVYSLSSQQKLKRLRSLLKSAEKARIVKGVVGQNMNGLSLAWNYFPHAWEVRCGSMITPKEVFFDDALLHKAILKQLTFGAFEKLPARAHEKLPTCLVINS